jgi:hypothetical protein
MTQKNSSISWQSHPFQSYSFQTPRALNKLRPIRVGLLFVPENRDWGTLINFHAQLQQALSQTGLQVIPLGVCQPCSNWTSKGWYQPPSTSEEGSQPDPIAEQLDFMVEVHRQLEQTPCDVIFVPAATAAIALLACNTPIIYLSDSGLQLRQLTLEQFLNRRSWVIENRQEQFAVARADLVIYLSQTAMNLAVETYDVDPRKLKVIPLEAQLDASDRALNWQQWAEQFHPFLIALLNRTDDQI